MYHNPQKLATRLYEVLDDLILEDDNGAISIDKLLNPQQKYDLIMSIVNGLPRTNHQLVSQFQDAIEAPKEETHVVTEFKHSKLRFLLILEEVLELAVSLGIDSYHIYKAYNRTQFKVFRKNIQPNLTNVLDALVDILYVTYGSIDTFNLTDVLHDAMSEVHTSNLTKLVENSSDNQVVKDTVRHYIDIRVASRLLKNNKVGFYDSETGKLLKPTTYVEPNLKEIINKHLNK